MSAIEQKWKTKQLTHENLPLFLRYPEKLDFSLYRSLFPQLAVIAHEFSKVSPNGMPYPDYNDGLRNFDEDIRKIFETAHRGVTVLIETFAGKRNYYIYVEPNANVTGIISELARKYPQEKLSSSVHPDAEWGFIEKYSSEFLK